MIETTSIEWVYQQCYSKPHQEIHCFPGPPKHQSWALVHSNSTLSRANCGSTDTKSDSRRNPRRFYKHWWSGRAIWFLVKTFAIASGPEQRPGTSNRVSTHASTSFARSSGIRPITRVMSKLWLAPDTVL